MSTQKYDNDVVWMSAIQIAKGVRAGELSVIDIAERMIEQIDSVNPIVNAIVDMDRDQIRSDAKVLQAEADKGLFRGPLHGVPYTLKGLTSVKGRDLNFGFLVMKGQIAEEDAAVSRRMKETGGLLLGITNTPESGYYGGCDNNLYGRTKNPWRLTHTPGGSSGGASAAVAVGLGPLAEGSDGAGSIRIPASLSGVVGFKPSTGLIPQTMFAGRFNNWLYHGPISRTVEDAALMLDVVRGYDPSDPMSLPDDNRNFLAATAGDIGGLRIAYSADLGTGQFVDEPTRLRVHEAADVFRSLGAEVTEASPPWGDPEGPMWRAIWLPAFAAIVDRFDWRSLRGKVDDYLIDIINEASSLKGLDQARAESFRGEMWNTFAKFMENYDLIISPTLSSVAFPATQFAPDWLLDTPISKQVLGWLQTYPFNMLNNPAISIPAGFSDDGLPVGLQIAGMMHADETVLRAAARFEEARPWNHIHPDLNAEVGV